ncbi:MAG: prephenate dehydrogenase/arogenate dehydrogenase family protein [Bacillota bacterium]|jgi:prephenate dehydrogenase
MTLPSRIAVVGLGLIGGSMALALKDRHSVVAHDPDLETCEAANALGIPTIHLSGAVKDAGLVILASPVRSLALAGLKAAPHLRKGAVITDVGSSKSEVVQDLEAHLPPHCMYVGGHPMAGSEKSGFRAARPDLFRGSCWVITPTGKTHPRCVEVVLSLVKELGAKPVFMSVAEHDRLVALVSHLPYLLSAALTRTVLDASRVYPEAAAVASAGFRDMTRLAACDPTMASDFCVSNKDFIMDALNMFLQHFREAASALQDDGGSLRPLLLEAKHFRDSLAVEKGW